MTLPAKITRRMLLKAGAGTAGAALLSPLTPHVLAAGRPLKVAAIGVGNRGADNLIDLQADDVSLVALCDVDDRYLQAAQQRFAGARTYRDYRKLLENEELDAVLISTPDHSHALPALLALRRGCHVYCEKPLAHNLHELRLMSQAATRHQAITQMANQHRTSDGYRRARQLLELGVLGTIHSLHAWTLRPYWPQGIERPAEAQTIPDYLHWDLWLGPAPQRPYHSTYHPLGWRGWWDFGAGALGDMGTHLLDPVVSALHLDAPEQITAEASQWNHDSLPARSIIRFSFPAVDGRPRLTLTWYDGGKQPPPEVSGVDRLPDEGVLVIGERGKMYIPPLGKMPRVQPAALLQNTPAAEPSQPDAGPIRQWLDAIHRHDPGHCSTPFAEGARLTRICLLGKLALRAGKPITWDAEQSAPVDGPECLPWLTREYRDGFQVEPMDENNG